MSKPRKLRKRCTVADKGCYRDEAAAVWGGQLVMRLEAIRGRVVPQLYVYQCRACSWWHLTRSPGRRDDPSVVNTPVPEPDVSEVQARAEHLRRERAAYRAAERDQLGDRLGA